ncbi:MAG: hypothetical protein M0R02_13800, partial [Bacteroidales bacterium]|nr:hypothetical protein [Bacteroidales bacterium]
MVLLIRFATIRTGRFTGAKQPGDQQGRSCGTGKNGVVRRMGRDSGFRVRRRWHPAVGFTGDHR